MSKKMIAVDFDDVILAEAEFVVEYSNQHWGYNFTLEDYRENWQEMWGLEAGEELEARAEALHAPGIQVSYDLIEGAETALKRLAKRYNLVVLTSRRGMVADETLEWIDKNLPDIFTGVHFTGFYEDGVANGHRHTKGVMAREIGTDYLIDDQPKHCFAAAEEGIKALLFGDYAVSRNLKLPKGVTRCTDWAAVVDYFEWEH